MAQYSNDDLANLAKMGIYFDPNGKSISNPYDSNYSDADNAQLLSMGITPKLAGPTISDQASGALTSLKAGAVKSLGGIQEAIGRAADNQNLTNTGANTIQSGNDILSQLPDSVKRRMSEQGFNGTKFIQGAAGAVPMLATGLAAGALAPYTGGASVIAAAPILGAAAGGESADETYNQIYQQAKQQGYSDTDAQTIANKQANSNLGQSFLLNTAGNLASLGVAHAVGTGVNGLFQGVQGGLKGAAVSALADLPINIGQTVGQEVIDANTQNRQFNTEQALESGINNALLGTALAAPGGYHGGKVNAELANNKAPLTYTPQEEGATPINYYQRSIPMREDAANKRVDFLTNQGDGTTQYQAIPQGNGKFVVGEIVPQPKPVEETTPDVQQQAIQAGNTANQLATEQANQMVDNILNQNKPLEAATQAGQVDDIANKAQQVAEQTVLENTPKQEDITQNTNDVQPEQNIAENTPNLTDKTIENTEQVNQEPVNDAISKPDNQNVSDATNNNNTYFDPTASLKEINSSRSNPKFNQDKISFNNDLDKAMYIVGDQSTASKNHENFVNFIKEKTGLNDGQITDIHNQIKQAVQSATPSNGVRDISDINFTKNNTKTSLEKGITRAEYEKQQAGKSNLSHEEMTSKLVNAYKVNPDLTNEITNNRKLTQNTIFYALDKIANGELKARSLDEILNTAPRAENYDIVNRIHSDTNSDQVPFQPKEIKKSSLPLNEQIVRNSDGTVSAFSTIRRPDNPDLIKQQGFTPDLKLSNKSNYTIEREPTNKDKNAIVIKQDGKKIGYVSSELAKQLSKHIDSGQLSNIKVSASLEHVPYSKFDSNEYQGFKKTFIKDEKGNEQVYRPIIEMKAQEKEPNFTYDTQNIKSKDVQTEPKFKADTAYELSDGFTPKEGVDPEVNAVAKSMYDTLNEKTNGNVRLSVAFDSKQNGSVRSIAQEMADKYGMKVSNARGFYTIDQDTGKPFIFINLDKIANSIKRADSDIYGMSLENAAHYTMAHEMMGHYALDNFFPSFKEKNAWLESQFDNSKIIQEVANIKKKSSAYSSEDKAGLAEEVLADLAANRIDMIDEKGINRSLTLDEFAQKYSDQSFVQRALDYIKSVINSLTGKDIFDSKYTELNKIKDTKDILDKMGEALKEAPEIQLGHDYLDGKFNADEFNRSISLKAENDNAVPYDYDYQAGLSDRLKYMFKDFYDSKIKNGTVLSYSSKANKDPALKLGLDLATKTSTDTTKYSSLMQKNIDSLIQSKYGIKSGGLTLAESQKLGKLFRDAELRKANFTEEELKGKKVDQKLINAYTTIKNALNIQNNHLANSLMFKDMINSKLIDVNSPESHQFQYVENYSPEQFREEMLKIAQTKISGDALLNKARDYNWIVKKNSQEQAAGVLPRIITGDNYITVRDKDKKLVDLKQFTSKFDQNRVARELATKYGDNFKVEKGSIAKGDLLDKESIINKLLNESQANALPVDFKQLIGKFANQSSKQISSNINLTQLKNHIEALGADQKTTDKSQDLANLKAWAENTERSGLDNLKSIAGLNFLGGSPAGALVNMTAIPINVVPYLMQYKGSAHSNVYLKALPFVTKDTFARLQGDNLKNAIMKDFSKEFSGNEKNVESALSDLIRDGILDENSASEIRKMANGLDTSKIANTKEALAKIWMLPFAESDRVNKQATVIGSLLTAMQDPSIDKSRKGLYDFVKDAVYQTQGNYSAANRPTWARSTLGGLIWQFHTFTSASIELWMNLMKKDKAAFAYMTGALVGIAGAQGLPFIQNAEDIIDSIGRLAGYNTNTQAWLKNMIGNVIGNKNANRLMYGTLDGNIGIGSRVGLGEVLPGTDYFNPTNKDGKSTLLGTFAGASGSVLNNFKNSVTDIAQGNYRKALEDTGNTGIRNTSQAITALQTGEFRNSKGQKMENATTGDIVQKFLGFQPGSLQTMQRRQDEIKSTNDMMTYVKQDAIDKMARGTVNNDPLLREQGMKLIQEWNKTHDVKIAMDYQSLGDAIKNMKLNSEQRFQNQIASTLRGVNYRSLKENQ